jgi:thiol-disulfide isomerase/thioredoxin
VPFSRRTVRWVVALAVVVLVPVLARAYQTRHWPSTELPSLEASTLRGQGIKLPDGAPVVVHFWATWCGTCRAEEPLIRSLAKDARVISVASLSGSARDVRAYTTARALPYEVVVDTEGTLAERFGVYAYPTTFFVDADGDILAREVGYVRAWGLNARWWLTK